MNILFVCSAKAWGGNEKWTSMAMQALSGNNRIFFIGKSEGLLDKFGKYNGAMTLPFRSYFDVHTFTQLKHFIVEHQIDVLVSTKKKEYFMCGIISRQLGIKHLIRLGANRKMNLPFWHKLNYKALNDGLIVNSVFIANGLKTYSFFHNHPIHILYNGIPGFESTTQLRERKTDNHKFVIVSSGRITKLKGYGLLIDAVSKLELTLLNQIEIRIIGEGRNKEEFEQQAASLGLNGTIRFYDFVDQPAELMRDADLFVLLSEREGLSNSILEAMTLGIPVLSTDTGGIKEIIKENETGYLVERNTEAITRKITELIFNKDSIRSVGENAFHLIKKQSAFDVFEKKINELFNRL